MTSYTSVECRIPIQQSTIIIASIHYSILIIVFFSQLSINIQLSYEAISNAILTWLDMFVSHGS